MPPDAPVQTRKARVNSTMGPGPGHQRREDPHNLFGLEAVLPGGLANARALAGRARADLPAGSREAGLPWRPLAVGRIVELLRKFMAVGYPGSVSPFLFPAGQK